MLFDTLLAAADKNSIFDKLECLIDGGWTFNDAICDIYSFSNY